MLTENDILYFPMAGCIPNLNFSEMSQEDSLQLANLCEESRAGLCHCLDFIGHVIGSYANRDTLELTATNLFKLGHSLNTISSLLPMLTDLEQLIRADLKGRDLLNG